ncbi:MAG: hypothetical protein WBY53_08595 [Acidobacteriaceae bacterium]
MKRSLVESFVGALALGGIFAWAILDFVSIFSAPLTNWIARSEFRRADGIPPGSIPGGLLWRDALPYLVGSLMLFLVGYLLLRWLYFKPLSDAEPSASGEE